MVEVLKGPESCMQWWGELAVGWPKPLRAVVAHSADSHTRTLTADCNTTQTVNARQRAWSLARHGTLLPDRLVAGTHRGQVKAPLACAA
eukprot:6020616-Alexandrium_andersonii.AAC.1